MAEDNTLTGLEIAVIGMAGRFPGARNIHEYWENIKNGVECIHFYSDEELEKAGVSPEVYSRPDYVKSGGGILEGAAYFDADFFGYNPFEAEILDPQLRLFHECSWEAIEDAGYDPGSYEGLIGLFGGAEDNNDWREKVLLSTTDMSTKYSRLLLSNKDFVTARISYKLNLKGPVYAVVTGCSTGMSAIHLASRSLLGGECDMALAGGVYVHFAAQQGRLYQEGMIQSSDGHLRAFDAKANGTVFGSGVGIVVLKPFEDAWRDHDHIYALIKGSAVNSDGNRKVNFTAPSVKGQAKVIKAAYQAAGVEMETIGYLETHGTGTTLGDPIEINALKQAFNTNPGWKCPIGSVKTNIGHLDVAAGAASFIKAVLILTHNLIPPSLNFETPNPKLELEKTPFYVNTGLKELESSGGPRRVGVSSFGFGGTNVHAVLEEAPEGTGGLAPLPEEEATQSRDNQLILLSAKTETALDKMTQNLAEYLKKDPGINLADAAYTLQLGRQPFQYRRVCVCSNPAQAVPALPTSPAAVAGEDPPVVFMFSGQGSQYVNMGLEIYRSEPVFREEMDNGFEILKSLTGKDFKNIFYPPAELDDAREQMNDFRNIGPIKFIFEYSLAKLLMHWGIRPHALIGHSFGEYTAACLAGVFTVRDALELALLRGELILRTPPGGMMSIPLGQEQLGLYLETHPDISISAVNSSSLCFVSGLPGALAHLEKDLQEKGMECIRINVPCAGHSHMMKPITGEFEKKVKTIKLNEPTIPFISCLTGDWLSPGEITRPTYWAKHLEQSVRFCQGVEKLLKEPGSIFVQVGADKGLPLFVNRHRLLEPGTLVINLIKHKKDKIPGMVYLLEQLGALWRQGVRIDWPVFYAKEQRQRIPLPTYPFEGKRCWIDVDFSTIVSDFFSRGQLKKRKNVPDWLYTSSWKRCPLAQEPTGDLHESTPCLIFTDAAELGFRLAGKLEEKRREVIIVKPGERFETEKGQAYRINPTEGSDYDRLFKALKTQKKIPGLMIHLWNVTGTKAPGLTATTLETTLDLGFYSLLHIVQSLGRLGIHQDMHLEVITDNMQPVVGEEELCPPKATIIGAVRVIPQEYPNISCHALDIILPEPGSPGEEQLLRHLVTALSRQSSRTMNPVTALRGNYYWTQVFEPIPVEEPSPVSSRLREGGVYLVTGGLGGIGFVLSEYLVKTVKARLILTGRSQLPAKDQWQEWLDTHPPENRVSQKIKKVIDLEQLGADVLVFSADSADLERMQEVITRSVEHFGQINGIIHTAGLVDEYGVIQNRTREMTDQILAPKVKGTVVLHQLTEKMPLDFFVICSSIASLFPGFGEVGYAAANIFIDAFAHYKTFTGSTFTAAVNWDTWQEVGGAVDIVERQKQAGKTSYVQLQDGILSVEGVEAFTLILENINPQVVVSTKDLELLLKRKYTPREEEKTAPEETDKIEKTTAKSNLKPRPKLSATYTAPCNPLQEKLVNIWQDYFGIEKVGIHDDFFELGGDSLMATIMAARIHKRLNTRIPLIEIFQGPTVELLSQYIKSQEGEEFEPIFPFEEKEYYPQSSGQKRIFFLDKFQGIGISYNMPGFARISKKMDRERCKNVIQALIKRHESLRMSFTTIHNEPVQRVHKPEYLDFTIEYIDASQQEEGVGAIVKEFIRPFDLSKAPLLRIGLLEVSTGDYLLMFDMHHIISDGTSLTILPGEFFKLSQGEELNPLRLQYKDFSLWQNTRQQKAIQEQQGNFWLNQFQGEIPVLNLPADYARPLMQNYAGSFISFWVPQEVTQKLKKLAAEEDVTLFMVLLALYNILLAKITGQEDIVVGTGVAGRRYPDLQDIMGIFVNTLVLRYYPTPGKTLPAFLKEIKSFTLEAFENQEYPFEELVQKLAIKRDTSRNPLFDTMLMMQNLDMPVIPFEGDGKDEKHHEFQHQVSKFDLSLFVEERSDQLICYFEYSTSLFKSTTIERLITYFKEIAASVSNDPTLTLKEIQKISRERRETIIYQLNQQLTEETESLISELGNLTLQQQLSGSFKRFNHLAAIEQGNQTVTYGELYRKSDYIANWIVNKGIPKQTFIGVLLENRVDFIPVMVGILKARCVFVPLDSSYPRQRLQSMIDTTELQFIIADGKDENLSLSGKSGAELILPGQVVSPQGPTKDYSQRFERAPHRSSSSEDIIYIYFTSGTTGTPRAMKGKNQSLHHFIYWEIDTFAVTRNTRISQFTTPVFDAFLRDVFVPLCSGGVICIPGEQEILIDSQQLTGWVEKSHISLIHCVPSLFRQLKSCPYLTRDNFRELQYILLSGEPVHPADVKEWCDIFADRIQLVNLWGTSETTLAKTCHFIEEADGLLERVPVGKPLPGARVVVLDEDMELCDGLVIGEVYIRTPFQTYGYFNDPLLNRERFIPNPFNPGEEEDEADRFHRSGDLGRLLADGNLDILGRNDRQVKIRGIRIELEEIETVLSRHPAVTEAVVIKKEIAPDNESLHAYITTSGAADRDGSSPSVKQKLLEGDHGLTRDGILEKSPHGIDKYLSEKLPAYMVPSAIVELEQMPRKPSGKIDYAALPDPLRESENDSIAPGDAVERKLVELWSEVLPGTGEAISPRSHFFLLGGNSLNVMSLISKIHREFDVRIPLGDFFTHPTLSQQAETIRRLKKEKYAAIDPVEKREYYALSSAQKRVYFFQQMDLSDISYNMPRAVILHGEVDKLKFKRVFKQLMERHESLRTFFIMLDGVPVQRVGKAVDFVIESYDAREHEIDEKIQDCIAAFDLARAPLLRTGLIRVLDENRVFSGKHILVIDMHHIILDEVSDFILIKEFMTLYSNGADLPRLKLHYKDYAQWQNRLFESGSLNLQEEYWLKRFSGDIPVLGLPYDYQRPAVQNFAGSALNFVLGKEETLRIRALMTRQDATLYMILLAIFYIFLSKVSGQEDIVVGTPIAGRRHTDLENIIGMFVNSLPLRNYPRAEKTVSEFFKEIKEHTLKDFENQEYPFEELVDKVNVNRDLGRNPVFDIMFALRNLDPGQPQPVFNLYDYETKISKFDLTLDIHETRDDLVFRVQYCTKLFKAETIQRFIGYLKNTVLEVTAQPDSKLSKLGIISEAEKKQLLVDFNETGIEYPKDKVIQELFAQQVDKTPDYIAVVGSGQLSVSYRELQKRSNRLARRLRKQDVRPDNAVGLMMERSVDMMVSILAILTAGGAYLPIDPENPTHRVQRILNDTGANILVTESKVIDNYSFTALQYHPFRSLPGEPQVCPPRRRITDLDQLPIPNRSLVNYEKYNRYSGLTIVKNSMSLQATRGCPYNCAYCSKIWPKKHFVRSAEHLAAEVEIYYKMGVRRFDFVDDIFNLDIENSQRFFRLIIQKDLNLQLFFPAGLRGDLLTEEYIDLMVQAGTVNIALALETASPRLQKLISKNLNLEKLRKNIEYITKKYPHVILELFTMHGFPTETEEEAMMTLEFIKQFQWLHFPYVHILKIYSNTDMEKLALANGVTAEAVASSMELAWHELPDTLPFPKRFTQQYQAEFLNTYFLNKERLLKVLPHQVKLLTEDEIVQKYNSYLPIHVSSLKELLQYVGIEADETGDFRCLSEEQIFIPQFNNKLKQAFPTPPPAKKAFRVLLLDLTQYYSTNQKAHYDPVEPPLGLMYILTWLQQQTGIQVQGRIAKSRIDFDSEIELKILLDQFKPHVIGIRTLTYYREFFHKTISLIRQWGIQVPVVAGGPYATSDYQTLLQDPNIDLAVLGEGEATFAHLVEKMIRNNNRLPGESTLKNIKGLAFVPGSQRKTTPSTTRDILLTNILQHSLEKESPGTLPTINHPANLAYILYTSGSTGKPKGVMVQHHSVVNLAFSQKKYFSIKADERVLQFSSIYFDASVEQIFITLFSGAALVLLDKDTLLDNDKFERFLSQQSITHLHAVPSFLKGIKLNPFFNLRRMISGGDACPPSLAKQWSQVCDFYNEYGPTETTVTSIELEIQPTDYTPVNLPIGKPIGNTCIYILDKWLNPVPPTTAGELYIGGEGVARGYLNYPELTAEKFCLRRPGALFEKTAPGPRKNFLLKRPDKDHMDHMQSCNHAIMQYHSPSPHYPTYHTGDLARWLPDGTIEFLGRMDQQVKIRGFRIELEEIEVQLVKHVEIKEAVVLEKEVAGSEDADKYLCAYIVPVNRLDPVELKEFLSNRLPGYMVPVHFVELEQIPLTSNGKVDRKSLRAMELVNPEECEEPQHPVEKKIAEIWADVLGRETVSVNDNFFVIGGDSIKTIQIVSRLNRAGYKIEIKDIFQNPTISQLTPLITKMTPGVDQKEVTGTVPLTPPQKEFFQQVKGHSFPINRAIVLYFKDGIAEDAVRAVFLKLQEHHDALRMIYKEENQKILQVNRGTDFPLDLQVVDYRQQKDAALAVEEKIKDIRGSIDLNTGPLMKLGLFHLNDGDRLLIVIHRLVADGVSWQILLNHMDTLFQQYKKAGAFVLPAKTAAYKTWAEKLTKYAHSPSFLQEKAYWAKLESNPVEPIKKDFPGEANDVKDIETLSFTLEENQGHLLLTTSNDAFGTEPRDIILTALGLGIKRTFGNEKILLALEDQGRGEILTGVDIKGTVGWFSTVYPLLLDFSYEDSGNHLSRQIKEVKECLRQVPHKGTGYGMLKYLTPAEHKEEVEFNLKPQLLVHDPGQLSTDQEPVFPGITKEFLQNPPGINTNSPYELEVSAAINAKGMTLSISYNKKQYKQETIEILLKQCKKTLSHIISYCTARPDREFTPSDFTYKGLSIETVEQLQRQYRDYPLEDIYTLTPMQEGMLFHILAKEKSPAYFLQVSYRLRGELDTAVVKQSLNELIRRHAVLRTLFVHKGVERPLQLVLKEKDIEFYYKDLRNITGPGEKEQLIIDLKEKDRRRSIDLSQQNPMWVTVLQLDRDLFEFTWNYHHILLDGWSNVILVAEYLEIYYSYLGKKAHRLPAVTPYRTYIQWLETQSKELSRAYWGQYLEGCEPTALPTMNTSRGEPPENKIEELPWELPKEKSRDLVQLAAANQVTLNTLFQTLWGILLGKYSDKQDVVFGAVVSGRPTQVQGVESIVGLFINTIPVRIRYRENTLFKELLRDVQERALESKPHHYYPLTKIQSALSIKGNLFDHLLAFENFPLTHQIEGIEDKVKQDNQSVELGLTNVEVCGHTHYDFIMLISGEPVTIKLQYNAGVFGSEWMTRIAQHWEAIIEQILAFENITIEDISLHYDPLEAEVDVTENEYEDFGF